MTHSSDQRERDLARVREHRSKIPGIALGQIWFVLPAMLTLVFVWTSVELPVDFWHRANSGRLMWQTGTLAEQDAFTHTIAGRPILNQNWLAELGCHGLVEAGGFRLARFAAGLCYAAAFLLVTAICWYRSQNVRLAAALAMVGLIVTGSNLGVRSQAISALLLTVELYALWRWPDRWSTVAIVALVELLWTNTHGAFPLGVVLPAIFFLGMAWKAWREGGFRGMLADRASRCCLVATLVAAAMMFCCPHPEKTVDYVLGVASKSSQRQIEEWLPTSLASYAGVMFWASVVATIAVIVLARRRLTALEALLLVAFALLACRAQRMVIWWALVAPTALAWKKGSGVFSPDDSEHASHKRLPTPFPEAPEERSPLNLLILLLLIGLLVMSTPWTRAYNPLLPPAKRAARSADEPFEAVEYLKRSGYGGRIFNPMEWGGYLSWHLQPEVKIFIDGRLDFYPDAVWDDYLLIAQARPGWEAALKRHGVDLIIWASDPSEVLPAALAESANWQNTYHDGTATVFVRRK